MPVFHCSSVIWNTSSPATAPAMLTKASMRPKRSSVLFTTISAAVGAIRSSPSMRGSAPIVLTCWPTSPSFSPPRAARTMAPKSRASRRAVAFPIPELAPVRIATDFDMSLSLRFEDWKEVERSSPGAQLTAGARRRCRAKNLASAAGYGADRVVDNVDDSCWSGDAGYVIDSVRPYLRLHALGHVALCLRDDHSIVFGNQKPTRNVLPKRAPDRNSDAVHRYRPLHGGEHGSIVRGCVRRERRLEGSFG